MPGRDITAGMVTALTDGVVRPVLIGRLDVLDDPVLAWTGPGVFAPSGSGDSALDGQVFGAFAPFIELGDIEEDQGIGNPTPLKVAAHDLDEDMLVQVVRDKRKWRGRKAWLWFGLLNQDEGTVVTDPFRIKTGYMTAMQITRSEREASLTVTIDADLGNARAAPYRWIDHQRIWTADTFSTFVIALSNKPEGFTRGDVYSGSDVAGPGFRTPSRHR